MYTYMYTTWVLYCVYTVSKKLDHFIFAIILSGQTVFNNFGTRIP